MYQIRIMKYSGICYKGVKQQWSGIPNVTCTRTWKTLHDVWFGHGYRRKNLQFAETQTNKNVYFDSYFSQLALRSWQWLNIICHKTLCELKYFFKSLGIYRKRICYNQPEQPQNFQMQSITCFRDIFQNIQFFYNKISRTVLESAV